MKIRLLLIATLSLLSINAAYSQKVVFTSDTAYVRELSTFLSKTKHAEIDTALIKLRQSWNSGKITANQKASIIKLSNILYNKRIRAYPHFLEYVNFIISSSKKANNSSNFDNTQSFLIQYSSKKNISSSQIYKLLEKLNILNHSNFIYKSRAVSWKLKDNNFKIVTDKNRLIITFPKTDLFCYSHRDSFYIQNTQGHYSPVTDVWEGSGGKLTWEYAGLSKDSVYATIKDYKINLKTYEFKAENSQFINKKILSKELTGLLEMKLLANKRGEKAIYPKFISKTKLSIKNIMPKIDYIGSISMMGNKIIGNKGEAKKAWLIINKDNNEGLITAKSDIFEFNFNSKQIDAKNVNVSIKIENDSISHSCVTLMYKQKSSFLILSRSGSKFPQRTFTDTYHNVDIDVDMLSFNLQDTVMKFQPLPMTNRVATFQSTEYFSRNHYNKMQMRDRENPILIVYRLVNETENTISLEAFSKITNKSVKFCENIIHRLASEGFVDYDKSSGTIYAETKLFDYVAANSNKKDYDIIKIKSKRQGVNGEINLNNNDLNIYGAKPFVLSYNRRVGIYPAQSKLTIKKDFNMQFNGRVNAGLIDLYGKEFKFNYEKFSIDIPKADTLMLHFISDYKDKDSINQVVAVKSPIRNVAGLLLIDKATNKSGKDSIHNYPIFESKKTANVYYEQVVNKDTVYKPEEFYFETIPFIMDSLNNLTRNHIKMQGTFTSGGIFPDIKESLTVQSDSSLGFIHNVGKTKGIKIYNGQGTYYDSISLDKKGLIGQGKLHHLTTDMYSNAFKFYPDSMNAFANNMSMLKQTAPKTQYPNAVTDSIYAHWEPKNKKMWLNSLNAPHNMFEGRVLFTGNLQLEPSHLGGSGKLVFLNAELNSETFHFLDNSFSTDTTNFILRKEGESLEPILAENVNANVDFAKDKGTFKSNGENSYMNFKINQYLCYMNYFVWKISKNKIDIGVLNDKNDFSEARRENIDIKDTSYSDAELAVRSKFISTNPSKDSLNFYAVSSTFDINEAIIKANNVKFIKIADIYLFPADKLIIQKNSNIDEIDGAKILADRNTNYHSFYNVHAKIIGANEYEASGDYEYVDKNENVSQIHFNKIAANDELITVATGEVPINQNFNLGKQFAFRGDVELQANRKHLYFSGFSKINHQCSDLLKARWFPFKSVINPDSIAIPITSNLLYSDSTRLTNGIYITKKDSIGMYASFLTQKMRINDYKIFSVSKGYLRYNDKLECFEIADSARFVNDNLQGNYLNLNRKLCRLTGKGKISLGLFTGQVQTNLTGEINYNPDNHKTEIEAMLGIDFHFDKNALKIMSESFNEENTLKAVDLSSKKYLYNLKEIVGYEKSKEYNEGFSLYGGFDRIPDSMNNTIFLSNIKLEWNSEYGTWVSKGKIGVSNFKKHQILKVVNGIMEVKRVGKRGIINLYLEINPSKWFFFSYNDGVLKTCSSEDEYDARVAKIKDKKRESRSKLTNKSFAYYPANEDAKISFVREMKKRYNFVSKNIRVVRENDDDIMDYQDDEEEINDKKKKKKDKKAEKIKKKKKEEESYEEEEEEEEEEE